MAQAQSGSDPAGDHCRVNPNAKAVYITLAPYGITLVDPKDPLSWDLGGLDPGTPCIIQMIAQGEL
ncbi:MAG: hypothetical protein AAGG51_30240 [Cyanobacteria bacterium P01_G01_bin.54]